MGDDTDKFLQKLNLTVTRRKHTRPRSRMPHVNISERLSILWITENSNTNLVVNRKTHHKGDSIWEKLKTWLGRTKKEEKA